MKSMKNKWTGGQYSLFRAILGLFLIIYYLKDLVFFPTIEGFFALMGVAAAIFLLVGKNDRIAALILTALLIGRLIVVEMDPRTVALLALVVFHACLPKYPYGSWDAQERSAQDRHWRMPQRYYFSKWVVMGLLYIWWAFWASNPTGGMMAFLVVVAFLILALSDAIRPLIWLLMWLFQIVLFAKGNPNGILLLAHWLLFDPGWIKSQKRGHDHILFYDAPCGLCSSFIRFLLAERPDQDQLKFASLKGATAQKLLEGTEGDTVILYHHGHKLLRWKAVAALLAELGGLWRLIAPIVKIFPDYLYNFIARHRHKVKRQACNLIPVEDQESFLP
jgi:predicted DCC family thiol-disulfide oxidoreductase YuxK